MPSTTTQPPHSVASYFLGGLLFLVGIYWFSLGSWPASGAAILASVFIFPITADLLFARLRWEPNAVRALRLALVILCFVVGCLIDASTPSTPDPAHPYLFKP